MKRLIVYLFVAMLGFIAANIVLFMFVAVLDVLLGVAPHWSAMALLLLLIVTLAVFAVRRFDDAPEADEQGYEIARAISHCHRRPAGGISFSHRHQAQTGS